MAPLALGPVVGQPHQQVYRRVTQQSFSACHMHNRACRTTCRSSDIRNSTFEKAAFGENFGARDPTAGELASNFGEKVLGNWDTEHIIKPPDRIKNHIGLTARSCKEDAGQLEQLTTKDIDLFKNQVPGWRVSLTSAGQSSLRCEWKCKDAAAAQQLATLLRDVSAQEEHGMDLKVEDVNVTAELSTPSVGGLSINDFILAAKINEVKVADLLPKKKQRFWA